MKKDMKTNLTCSSRSGREDGQETSAGAACLTLHALVAPNPRAGGHVALNQRVGGPRNTQYASTQSISNFQFSIFNSQFRPSTPLLHHSSSPHCLANTHGFWQLTLAGQRAAVPQDHALFYVAWLLAHPSPVPIAPEELAAQVYETFSDHPDFSHGMAWIGRHHDQAAVAKVLAAKQKMLEAILDSPGEDEPVKAEAARELKLVYDFQKTYFAQLARSAKATTEILSTGLRRLYAGLATAMDCQGNPHPVLRPFSRHLLLYLLIPSVRASGQGTITRFTYQPPPGVSWQP